MVLSISFDPEVQIALLSKKKKSLFFKIMEVQGEGKSSGKRISKGEGVLKLVGVLRVP